MRSKSILISALCLISLITFGCGSDSANNGNAATNSAKTETPVAEQVTNDAPTLTPVFKAYCEAWVKNDEAALRNVYSKDTIKYFEEMMKQEKTKSLIKFLEVDKVSGKLCEVRNETITGDTAVAEIRSEVYPSGIKIVFEKEGDAWKMTNKSPESITRTKADSNSVKPVDPSPDESNANKAEPKKDK